MLPCEKGQLSSQLGCKRREWHSVCQRGQQNTQPCPPLPGTRESRVTTQAQRNQLTSRRSPGPWWRFAEESSCAVPRQPPKSSVPAYLQDVVLPEQQPKLPENNHSPIRRGPPLPLRTWKRGEW